MVELLAFGATYSAFRASDVSEGKPAAQSAPRMTMLLVGDEIRAKHIYQKMAATQNVPYVCVFAGDFVANGYVGLHMSDLAHTIMRASDQNSRKAQTAMIHFMGAESIGQRDFQGDVGGVATQRMIQSLLNDTDLIPSRDHSHAEALRTGGMQFVFSATSGDLLDSLRRRQRGGYDADDQELPVNACMDITVDDLVRDLKFKRELAEHMSIRMILPPASGDSIGQQLRDGKQWEVSRFTDYLQSITGVPLSLHDSCIDSLLNETEQTEGNVGLCANVIARKLSGSAQSIDPKNVRLIELNADVFDLGQAPWLYPGESNLPAPTLRGKPGSTGDPDIGSAMPDISGWSEEQIGKRIAELRKLMGYEACKDKSPGKWWMTFEDENKSRKGLILRLQYELWVKRQASITEFFMAYVYSNTPSIPANLAYLDYLRFKREEEKRRRDSGTSNKDTLTGTIEEVNLLDQQATPAEPVEPEKPAITEPDTVRLLGQVHQLLGVVRSLVAGPSDEPVITPMLPQYCNELKAALPQAISCLRRDMENDRLGKYPRPEGRRLIEAMINTLTAVNGFTVEADTPIPQTRLAVHRRRLAARATRGLSELSHWKI